ncbi:MAG: DUF1499 domain-containing protein [Chloroflexota bacterium]
MRILLIILAVLLVLAVAGIFYGRSIFTRAPRPRAVNQSTTELAPCPDSPNCVSTTAQSENDSHNHRIEPIPFEGSGASAQDRLVAILNEMDRVTIIENKPGYLYAEIRSAMMQFVDDLELVINESERVIHVRSASRTGYSDMGVNRSRFTAIKEAFLQN